MTLTNSPVLATDETSRPNGVLSSVHCTTSEADENTDSVVIDVEKNSHIPSPVPVDLSSPLSDVVSTIQNSERSKNDSCRLNGAENATEVGTKSSTAEDNDRDKEDLPEKAQENDVDPIVTPTSELEVLYGIEDIPPWHLCGLLGFQHYLMMLSSLISIPYLLAPSMCMSDNDPGRGHMVSTIMFVGGLSTLLQASFGSRLPIVQGGTLALIIPALAILNHPRWKCGESEDSYLQYENPDEYWMRRMREIQGGVAIAGLFEMLMGLTGMVGLLLRFITPLGIAPTIALIGLATFQKAAELASGNWGISFMTMVLLVLFSQYLQSYEVPCLTYKRNKGLAVSKYPLFKVFSVLLTMLIMWVLSIILTTTNAFGPDSLARTDRNMKLLTETPWFRVPYPGQWGMPTVSAGAVLGMAAGVTASIVESIGDYYACARISGVPQPPRHAMNRGIAIEGFGCILGGIWGSGNGTTSYSQNIAAIGITRVASRRVVMVCAGFMIVFAVFGKFNALFVTIPQPIVGGIFCILFGMITSVGLSNLQYVNLESSRNMFILGVSLFLGLAIPKWLEKNEAAIQTGSDVVDQIATILLSTPMFVGGFLGVFLDNTIPGTASVSQHQENETDGRGPAVDLSCYDFPYGMDWVRRTSIFQRLPISPTFRATFSKLKAQNGISTTGDADTDGTVHIEMSESPTQKKKDDSNLTSR